MTLPDPTSALRAVAPLPRRRRSQRRRASAAYAQHTRVPIAHSQAEISRTLNRYGATWVGVGLKPDGSGEVAFDYRGQRFKIPVPAATDRDATKREQEQRRRWRVALITIKAMLEAVTAKLLPFEALFLPFLEVPGLGQTVAERLLPKIATGELLALLAQNPESEAP
jgi:hypothetical protein